MAQSARLHSVRVYTALLIAIGPLCAAQTIPHKKKPAPKPVPTAQELFAYVRGALISFSPEDGINDNLEVALDPAGNVLAVKQPDGHCDLFLKALDANTLVWDIFDASDSVRTRTQILRLTVVSATGKTARTCYDNQDHVDKNVATNRARFLFSVAKTEEATGFQAKMTRAMKNLIALSGGAEEKDIF